LEGAGEALSEPALVMVMVMVMVMGQSPQSSLRAP